MHPANLSLALVSVAGGEGLFQGALTMTALYQLPPN